MSKFVMALMVVFVLTPVASAHEGHAEKVMGTVTAIRGDRLEITTVSGKSSVIKLTDKTKIVKGRAAHGADGIQVGRRVVIIVSDVKGPDGKIVCVARQVSIGTTAAKTGRK